MTNDQRRRPSNAQDAAEAVFKPAAPKIPEAPRGPAPIPGVKELVSLRLDQEVLAHFQDEGPGWQDRINAALRRAANL